MSRSAFDTFPAEIILLVVDYLGLKDLHSLLRVIRWLPGLLTRKHAMMIEARMGVYGNTILHLLAISGETDLIEALLLNDNINLDPMNWYCQTPLFYAAKNGSKEIVKLLLMKEGVNPDRDDIFGWTPLWWAAVRGHHEIMKMLLTQGNANPEWAVDCQTLLSWAARRGEKETVEILLATERVDPNREDSEYSRKAVLYGYTTDRDWGLEMLRAVDRIGPNHKPSGRTPLLWAAMGGHKEVVELLLTIDGINLNSVDPEYGRTPLLWAATNGHKDIVELLLSKGGVDPDSKADASVVVGDMLTARMDNINL
jgi:ankyrin repeat protein